MSLSIRLLGRPSIPAADENGEQPRMSGGQKPWALLAYLLLIPEGATRRDLAERIWPRRPRIRSPPLAGRSCSCVAPASLR